MTKVNKYRVNKHEFSWVLSLPCTNSVGRQRTYEVACWMWPEAGRYPWRHEWRQSCDTFFVFMV